MSHVLAALAAGSLSSRGIAMDMGCGGGHSCLHLARQATFDEVVGIDISPIAIERAQAALTASPVGGPRPTFACVDALDEAAMAPWQGRITTLLDCQFFHAVATPATAHAVAAHMVALLAPGGRLLLVAGRALDGGDGNQPLAHTGPPRLTRAELLEPFVAAGVRCVSLEAALFDATPAYDAAGPTPPPAWVAIFERTC